MDEIKKKRGSGPLSWIYKRTRDIFSTLTCCINSQEENVVEKCFVNNGSQYDIKLDSTTQYEPIDQSEIVAESKNQLNITLLSPKSLTNEADLKTSIVKLDSLIDALSDIQNQFKEQLTKTEENKSKLSEENVRSDELLSFNVQVNENTCIHCHTIKRQRSLKETETEDTSIEEDLLSVHRCPPELSISKKLENNSNFGKVLRLQRSYHTLSYSHLGRFSSHILGQINSIRSDLTFIKNFICSSNHVVQNEKKPKLIVRFSEIVNILFKGNLRREQSLFMVEDVKSIKAKTTATNFCKFYNLNKKMKLKEKRSKKGKEKKRSVSLLK